MLVSERNLNNYDYNPLRILKKKLKFYIAALVKVVHSIENGILSLTSM